MYYDYNEIIDKVRNSDVRDYLDDNQDVSIEVWLQADGRLIFIVEGEREYLDDLACLLAKVKHSENHSDNLDIDVAEFGFTMTGRDDIIELYVESPYKKEHFNFQLHKDDIKDIDNGNKYVYNKDSYLEYLATYRQDLEPDDNDDVYDWLVSELEWARSLSNDSIILSGYDDGRELEFI